MNLNGPWPEDLTDRMWRAIENVRERLVRSTGALDRASVPYAVIGAHAVALWVRSFDDGADRNTPNVDLLIRPTDLASADRALATVGFGETELGLPTPTFVDGHERTPRLSVRLWFCGERIGKSSEPLPDFADAVRIESLPVWPLEVLVRVKLAAMRLIDNVHIRDLIGVGAIDDTWPAKYPEPLAERLREILADPDG